MSFLEFCISTSFMSLAVHISINWDGMIFNFAKRKLDNIPQDWIRKPLYECLPCMGSLYTIIHYLLAWRYIDIYVVGNILCVVGINSIISLMFRLLEAIENLENIDK